MLRNLVILAAVVLIVLIVRNRLRSRADSSKSANSSQSHQNTVQCAHCQHYLPKDDAVKSAEQYFCNLEHQQAWQDDADS
jgi:ribosomal protein S26